MYSKILFGLFLLALAALLVAMHRASWQQAQARKLSEDDRDFAWRQYRRRMQASAMVAIIAVAIGASAWLPHRDALLVTIYWMIVLALLVWVLLLAFADMIATRRHFSQKRDRQLIEQAKLQAEIALKKQQIQAERAANDATSPGDVESS